MGLQNKLEVSAVFLHNQGIVGESPQALQSAKSPENLAIRIDMTSTQQYSRGNAQTGLDKYSRTMG